MSCFDSSLSNNFLCHRRHLSWHCNCTLSLSGDFMLMFCSSVRFCCPCVISLCTLEITKCVFCHFMQLGCVFFVVLPLWGHVFSQFVSLPDWFFLRFLGYFVFLWCSSVCLCGCFVILTELCDLPRNITALHGFVWGVPLAFSPLDLFLVGPWINTKEC